MGKIQLDHPELYQILDYQSGSGPPPRVGDPDTGPAAEWDCDPARSYIVAFYVESTHAYGKTHGYATPQGGLAYLGGDLYMEGSANYGTTRYYNVGGTQTLIAPIIHADFRWDYGPVVAGAVPESGYWEFMVLLWIPPEGGPGDPGVPCPPPPVWPYADPVINTATTGGVIRHRRTIGSAFR